MYKLVWFNWISFSISTEGDRIGIPFLRATNKRTSWQQQCETINESLVAKIGNWSKSMQDARCCRRRLLSRCLSLSRERHLAGHSQLPAPSRAKTIDKTSLDAGPRCDAMIISCEKFAVRSAWIKIKAKRNAASDVSAKCDLGDVHVSFPLPLHLSLSLCVCLACQVLGHKS